MVVVVAARRADADAHAMSWFQSSLSLAFHWHYQKLQALSHLPLYICEQGVEVRMLAFAHLIRESIVVASSLMVRHNRVSEMQPYLHKPVG